MMENLKAQSVQQRVIHEVQINNAIYTRYSKDVWFAQDNSVPERDDGGLQILEYLLADDETKNLEQAFQTYTKMESVE